MTFPEYLAQPGAKTMQEVADDSGISYQTIKAIGRGMKLVSYPIAKKVSEATRLKGKATGSVLVSIEELCT